MNKRHLMYVCAVALIASCGGGGLDGGQIALEIENAYQPADIEMPTLKAGKEVSVYTKDGIDPLRVKLFRVTISAEDMEEPLITEADADAKQIQVLGISPGLRDVLIEAFNGREEVIRRRLIEDVIIKAGVVTPIKTSLNTIPIILNFKNNAVILSKYFRIHGFGEPEASIAIQSSGESGALNLCINAAGEELTVSPDTNTGLFEHSPGQHVIGQQEIVLTDTNNGESSRKTVTLVNANDRPGVRFVTSGAVNRVVTVGTGLGGLPEHHYPLVLDVLTAF